MARSRKPPVALSPLALELSGRLAGAQGQQAQQLNIELGQEIARSGDPRRVDALIELLADRKARGDALKALYEGGYLVPEILVPHVDVFFGLLSDRANRMVWGGMIALGTLAQADPDVVWERRAEILEAAGQGTVITQEWAFRALVTVAASAPERLAELEPWIVETIVTGRDKDLVRRAERALPVLSAGGQAKVAAALNERGPELGSKTARQKAGRLARRYV